MMGAEPMIRIVAVAAIAVFLGGCTTAAFRDGTGGATGQQWHGPMLPGSEPATFVTPRCPMIGNEWAKCNEAAVWPAPPGQEAYSYVYKVKIRVTMFYVPVTVGERPVTAYVLGDRAECMKQSEAHNWRKDGRVNEGNLRLSTDPAERCAGPFYIRLARFGPS